MPSPGFGLHARFERDLKKVFFRQRDGFGEPATYTPVEGDPFEINLYYNEGSDFQAPSGKGHASIEASVIDVRVQESDIPGGPQNGDKLTVRGALFSIDPPETTGRGYLILTLRRDS